MDYQVLLNIRVDWSELDYFGHVNNVAFFKYIQASRVYYWDTIGLTDFHKENHIGPLLASCKCDFKHILHYPEEIRLLSRIAFIKNTSFGISHQILNSKGVLAAEAEDVMVMFDFNRNEKTNFPKQLKERIEKLEFKKL